MNYTDEQIIQALECCRNNGTSNTYCDDCAYSVYEDCGARQAKDVLDLINRLKAENEGLKRKIESNYLVNTKTDKVISLLIELNKSQEQIKSEARKEFAERLKEKSSSCVTSTNGREIYETKSYTIMATTIDNLLEEMEKENG